ncbi:hypothetical protein [Candidatus Endomicrobiellum trichonymphae]|uniref:hypothetical protein n=1 Tax=Endomicrobium trichonymphae TaxID=1408204 RepID=UPI000BAA7D04|nr:hypothetical protein [Candidatus Endomicrobium trichonymphae]
MISWTALTLLYVYFASKRFDYVKTKVDNKVMQVGLLLFRNRLKKAKICLKKCREMTKRFACRLQ